MSIYRAKCKLCDTEVTVNHPREFGSALRAMFGHLRYSCDRVGLLRARQIDAVAHDSVYAVEDSCATE